MLFRSQVHYIGYPGTTGVDFIDYLIADAFVVPPDRQDCFTENVVYLPESYQINDRRRAAAPRRPTRTEQGLPDDAFVFASFNATYKIAPAMFDVWVRLVKAVPHAVLWLFADNPWAAANLRREAETRGLDPARLIVAGHAALAEDRKSTRLNSSH